MKPFLITTLFVLLVSYCSLVTGQNTTQDYLPKTVIFKVKPEYREVCKKDGIDYDKVRQLFKQLGVVQVAKKFPTHILSSQFKDSGGNELVDLSLIYEFWYSADMSIEKVINALYSLGIVEYAQPHSLANPLYIPNDPLLSDQYYLTNIRAFDGW